MIDSGVSIGRRETSFGRIIDAVESAEHAQALIERLAERLAGYRVSVVLAAAALTLAVTHNIVATISALIVAGACWIAAGMPLSRSARRAAEAGSPRFRIITPQRLKFIFGKASQRLGSKRRFVVSENLIVAEDLT